ncbi:MAG: HXXEE domain-containing protein [Rothia sp. (in: high G+C Gram-positive bacteria)]|nr:HXXEE domain-containing protein [Rothia sp. (in: high G+C Gram-positive bacteria)]
MSALNWYIKNWPKIGIVASTGIAGWLAVKGKSTSSSRALALANLATLGAHQFEEHVFPGYFTGVFNQRIAQSQTPENYPTNARTAMLINTALAYPFNLAPVVWPQKKWLGLAPVLFGFSQALGHCLAMPLRAKTPYVPGAITTVLLYVPIGAAWIKEEKDNGGFTRSDLAKTAAYVSAYIVGGIILPQKKLNLKDSVYKAQPYQLKIPSWNSFAALLPGPRTSKNDGAQ